jgi:hypothetical protein
MLNYTFFFKCHKQNLHLIHPAYKTGLLQSIHWPILAERTAIRQAAYEAWRGRSRCHGSGVSLQKRKNGFYISLFSMYGAPPYAA